MCNKEGGNSHPATSGSVPSNNAFHLNFEQSSTLDTRQAI